MGHMCICSQYGLSYKRGGPSQGWSLKRGTYYYTCCLNAALASKVCAQTPICLSSRQRGIQRSIRFGSETQVNVVGISPLEAGTNLAHPISMCTTVTTTASISTQTSVTSTASISTQTSVTATASRSTTYTQTVSRVSNKKV